MDIIKLLQDPLVTDYLSLLRLIRKRLMDDLELVQKKIEEEIQNKIQYEHNQSTQGKRDL